MTQISITRALSQLKTLDGRIRRATSDCQPVVVVVGSSLPSGITSETELKSKIQGSVDKPLGLIKARNEIKRKIVLSNATTQVTIGGLDMTVAEAIEQKATIEYKKTLLDRLREYLAHANHAMEREEAIVRDRADKAAETLLGSSAVADKGTEYTGFMDKFMEKNGPKLVQSADVAKLVEQMDDEITRFESEVDYVLSESNARTMIEVADSAL